MAAFEKAAPRLSEEGIKVIGASTDPLDKAAETVNELGLGIPIGYGLPLKTTAANLGAFYEERRSILHATNFLVKPDGMISVALYSSGPIGRLVWQDVLALVQFSKKRAT